MGNIQKSAVAASRKTHFTQILRQNRQKSTRLRVMEKAGRYPEPWLGTPSDCPPSYTEAVSGIPPHAQHVQAVQTVQGVTRVVQVHSPSFGPHPQVTVCPSCGSQVTTKTSEKSSPLAWLLCCALCFTALWPCACLPFCVSALNTVKHSCPLCKITLGKYKDASSCGRG